jgi:chromosome segregation ATPase
VRLRCLQATADEASAVHKEIARVEDTIQRVEGELKSTATRLEQAMKDGSPDLIHYYMKRRQLRKKEEQLRKKEEQLRKKEEQLRDEKKLLMEKELMRQPSKLRCSRWQLEKHSVFRVEKHMMIQLGSCFFISSYAWLDPFRCLCW